MKPDWLEDGDFITKVCVGVLAVCFLVFIAITASLHSSERNRKIIVDWNSPQFIGERSGYYASIFINENINEKLPDEALKEFEEEKDSFAIAHSNDELIRLYGISFKEGTLSDLAVECNSKLFDICNKYFLATYQGVQLSPLIPMAIANIETGNRADQSITYSSLFPSKCVPVTSAEAISNMSCIAVLESPQAFSQLASDHWTRDRGALQMNPNYGVGTPAFDSLMGPSEASILSNIDSVGMDFSGYLASEPRLGRMIDANIWLSQLSSTPGDRFNVKDSVLRLASAAQEAVDQYSSQYEIKNDMEMMALVAMQHNSGSVWNPSYSQRRVGNWRSGFSAHSYLEGITCDAFTKKLRSYCLAELESARSEGRSIRMTLDRSDAKVLFEEAHEEGLVMDYGTYVQMGNYYEVTYCYPIQALYAYMMLGLIYSGK